MCAIPAWKYDLLDAATAPEVEGPMRPTTLWSATNFCAAACAGAGPCSTGVSNGTSVIFSPSVFGISLTASFAHVSCSVPRKPAPPVRGVTNPIFIGEVQLIFPDFAGAAVLCGSGDDAPTTSG